MTFIPLQHLTYAAMFVRHNAPAWAMVTASSDVWYQHDGRQPTWHEYKEICER